MKHDQAHRRFLSREVLDLLQNLLFGDTLVSGDKSQDRIQCSDSKKTMSWYRQSLVSRIFCLQNHVTADLMNHGVTPLLAKMLCEKSSSQIPWQLHERDRLGEGKALVPDKVKSDTAGRGSRCIEEIATHCLINRRSERGPVITLGHDGFGQTFGYKAAIFLLHHLKDQLLHMRNVTRCVDFNQPRTYLNQLCHILVAILLCSLTLHASVLDEDGGGPAKPAPAPVSASAPLAPASTPKSLQPSVSQPTSAPSQPASVSAPASIQPSASQPPSASAPSEAPAPSEKVVPSEQTPSTIAPKKKSKAPSTDLSSVPDASSVSVPHSLQSSTSQPSSDPYLSLAEALAKAAGGNGKVNVGVGNFLYEDTDLLSPYSSMLKDELSMGLSKEGKFTVITRERMADLQNEGKFQGKDIVEPGTEAKKVQSEGVQGSIRGRFYYQPPNLTIYAEIAYLDGGEVHKVKVVIPSSEVAARIWPSDTGKQSRPEVAIAPQAIKESTASIQDIESKVRKVEKNFPLEIATVDGKRGYAEGETVSFRCRSGHDAYIAVIDHQIDGSEILLFPNAFSSENYMPAGKAIDVPGTVKHGFEIQISPPFGSDVVQVIACTKKDELAKITSTFPSATQASPYAVKTRGMKVVAVDEAQKNSSMESQPPQWSEDHIVVSTYPKVN